MLFTANAAEGRSFFLFQAPFSLRQTLGAFFKGTLAGRPRILYRLHKNCAGLYEKVYEKDKNNVQDKYMWYNIRISC